MKSAFKRTWYGASIALVWRKYEGQHPLEDAVPFSNLQGLK